MDHPYGQKTDAEGADDIGVQLFCPGKETDLKRKLRKNGKDSQPQEILEKYLILLRVCKNPSTRKKQNIGKL